MAITLENRSTFDIELDQFTEFVDRKYKSISRDDLIDIAPSFSALANNKTFLKDSIIRQLKDPKSFEKNNHDNSQSIKLAAIPGKFYLRANVWLPESSLHTANIRGESHFYSYGLPHDHNFDFLTVGYSGPGYETDIYEYDGHCVRGTVGEKVSIKFLETTDLPEGKLMVFRGSRDIHIQKYPEAFSVSLNLITSPTGLPRDQYMFDIESQTIAGILRSNTLGQSLIVEAAASLCKAEDIDGVLRSIAKNHKDPRTRRTTRNVLERSLAGRNS